MGINRIISYEFPELDFEEVGIFAEDDYTLVLILDKELQLLNEDGSFHTELLII